MNNLKRIHAHNVDIDLLATQLDQLMYAREMIRANSIFIEESNANLGGHSVLDILGGLDGLENLISDLVANKKDNYDLKRYIVFCEKHNFPLWEPKLILSDLDTTPKQRVDLELFIGNIDNTELKEIRTKLCLVDIGELIYNIELLRSIDTNKELDSLLNQLIDIQSNQITTY